MTGKQREKNFKYMGPLNCSSSQFNTIQLSEKSKLNKCPHCLKTFTKPSGLKAHIFSHTGEKPHRCPVTDCSRYFSLLSNLRRHMKIHTKDSTRTRSFNAKKSVPKIRPLLPVGPSSTSQFDINANQMDQGHQFSSGHGIAPNYDYGFLHRESVTSVEFSPLPVTPNENWMFNNTNNISDKDMDSHSCLLTYSPIPDLDAYLPSDDFPLQTSHGNLEDTGAYIPTPTFSAYPVGLVHPPWTTVQSSEPQLSMEEFNHFGNIDSQYRLSQQHIYPHEFFLKGDFPFYR